MKSTLQFHHSSHPLTLHIGIEAEAVPGIEVDDIGTDQEADREIGLTDLQNRQGDTRTEAEVEKGQEDIDEDQGLIPDKQLSTDTLVKLTLIKNLNSKLLSSFFTSFVLLL